MQYLHTMVRIHDIDESLDFYCRKLGLEEHRRVENEKGRFTLIFLRAPDDRQSADSLNTPLLELTYNWPEKDGNKEEYQMGGRAFGHLAYRVDDIYTLCEHLIKNGITINRPPRDGHMAFIKSPEGIFIELLQKGDPLPPKSPWKDMENTGSW